MKIFDVTHDLARFVSKVMTGEATDGSTTTVVDANLHALADTYKGGTIWITSGTHAGVMRRIASNTEGTITLVGTALASAIVSGVTYTLASPLFPLNDLKSAINSVLAVMKIAAIDETLTVDTDIEEYDLPDGVRDVRRVEIATHSAAPYQYAKNYYWEERGDILIIPYGIFEEEDGNKIRLTYAKLHGAVGDTDEIDAAVDAAYLRYSAAVNLWRGIIQEIDKDLPQAVDMLNEAKVTEANAYITQKGHALRVIPRDPKMAWW